MNDDAAVPASEPVAAEVRRKPGPKPGSRPARNRAPTSAKPAREVAMNPASGGAVVVTIRMELPLALGIELLTAVADIQAKADGGEPRNAASPFPKAQTRWAPKSES